MSKIKSALPYFILFAILDLIFLTKYLYRWDSNWGPVVGLGIAVIKVVLAIFCLRYKVNIPTRVLRLAVILYALLYLILIQRIDPMSVNVDRWSVITSFWDAYFSGDYAYFADSHLGNKPGPFPFYFILALPAYLIGEIGILSIAGVAFLFNYIISETRDRSLQLVLTAMLLSAAPIFWELYVRSALLFNVVLVNLFLVWTIRNWETKACKPIFGLLAGLLLCTRGIFILPYALTGIYLIRIYKVKISIIFFYISAAVIGFIGCFLPFIWGFWEQFLVVNPISIQSGRFITESMIIASLIFSIGLGIKVKTHLAWAQAQLSLMLFVNAIYFFYSFYRWGFYDAYLGSKIDISYLLFCFPWIFICILFKHKKKKSTGGLLSDNST